MTTTEPVIVCGVDEAGRGPLAGPVVAAAVVLCPDLAIDGLADSKVLLPARRVALTRLIRRHCEIGVGLASVAEIDRLNILQATLLAMARAVAALPRPPGRALVDGNRPPALACAVECVVGGDATVPVISAASIVAKTYRDALMARLARRHPGYGWERNAGYATAAHRAALARLGPSAAHRRTFGSVKALLSV